MAFAENLKTAREKKQISQYELAEMVGLTQTAIAYFELGTRQPNIQRNSLLTGRRTERRKNNVQRNKNR